jgi:hypothetical protein
VGCLAALLGGIVGMTISIVLAAVLIPAGENGTWVLALIFCFFGIPLCASLALWWQQARKKRLAKPS